MAYKVTLTGDRISAKLQAISSDPGLGIFAAEEMGRGMNPYVPMDQGDLSQAYETTPFMVKYLMIYARYQYNGEGFNFSREMHPLATAKWDKAWFSARGAEFLQSLEDYAARM